MKKINKNTLRIPSTFYKRMLEDLQRPHPFASERVGFFSTARMNLSNNNHIVIVTGYHSVPDEYYIDDSTVGAKINGDAIRECRKRILSTGMGCIHVHLHYHSGKPGPSFTDRKSLPELAESFYNINPSAISGYAIFSRNSAFCSLTGNTATFKLTEINSVLVIGYPFRFLLSANPHTEKSKWFSRQSFLGDKAQDFLSSVTIGIVGLGGGGSHMAQQLAHLGIINFNIFDGDHIEDSNHNRLIGGWFSDIASKLKKTLIARRMIKKINPKAKVRIITDVWQNKADLLKECDIVVGCVDSYIEREQLESACRRALIPLVDIGMDVFGDRKNGYSIGGQIILSMPGDVCMRCLRFITEEKLSAEAKKYGSAGGRPQVVWPNGVLASTAIGVIVDIVTGWSSLEERKVYLTYDGELGLVANSHRIDLCKGVCPHYKLDNSGDVVFKKI